MRSKHSQTSTIAWWKAITATRGRGGDASHRGRPRPPQEQTAGPDDFGTRRAAGIHDTHRRRARHATREAHAVAPRPRASATVRRISFSAARCSGLPERLTDELRIRRMVLQILHSHCPKAHEADRQNHPDHDRCHRAGDREENHHYRHHQRNQPRKQPPGHAGIVLRKRERTEGQAGGREMVRTQTSTRGLASATTADDARSPPPTRLSHVGL